MTTSFAPSNKPGEGGGAIAAPSLFRGKVQPAHLWRVREHLGLLMATEFEHAIDALFADRNLAGNGAAIVTAEYRPAAGGSVAVTVIKVDLETAGPLLSQEFRLSPDRQAVALLVDLRKSEIALPQRGDTVVIDGQTYIVGNTPQLDEEKLVWRLPLTKA